MMKKIVVLLVGVLVGCGYNSQAPPSNGDLGRDGCNEVVVDNQAYEDVTVYLQSPKTRIGRVGGLQREAFVQCNLLNRNATFVLERRLHGEAWKVGYGQRIEDWDGFYISVDVVFRNSHLETYTVE